MESDAAVTWQRQWLRGDAARGSEAEVLGGRIGEEEEVSGEAVPTGALSVLDSLTAAALEGATDAVVEYLEAVRWRTELDLPGTNLDSARADWQSWPAPDLEDASEVMRLWRVPSGRCRGVADTLQQRHARALAEGTSLGWFDHVPVVGGVGCCPHRSLAPHAVRSGWLRGAPAIRAFHGPGVA